VIAVAVGLTWWLVVLLTHRDVDARPVGAGCPVCGTNLTPHLRHPSTLVVCRCCRFECPRSLP
jgi:hypothetical protein